MPSTVAIGQCGQGATSLAFNFNSLKSTYPPRASGCYHVGQHSSKLGLGSGHRHASSMPPCPSHRHLPRGHGTPAAVLAAAFVPTVSSPRPASPWRFLPCCPSDPRTSSPLATLASCSSCAHGPTPASVPSRWLSPLSRGSSPGRPRAHGLSDAAHTERPVPTTRRHARGHRLSHEVGVVLPDSTPPRQVRFSSKLLPPLSPLMLSDVLFIGYLLRLECKFLKRRFFPPVSFTVVSHASGTVPGTQ